MFWIAQNLLEVKWLPKDSFCALDSTLGDHLRVSKVGIVWKLNSLKSKFENQVVNEWDWKSYFGIVASLQGCNDGNFSIKHGHKLLKILVMI